VNQQDSIVDRSIFMVLRRSEGEVIDVCGGQDLATFKPKILNQMTLLLGLRDQPIGACHVDLYGISEPYS
jgi:hypothetical protein